MLRLWDLLRQEAGAVVTAFAFATPLVIGGALFAVDATSLARHHAQLQGVADSAAIAGAKELHLYRSDYGPMQAGVGQRALAIARRPGVG